MFGKAKIGIAFGGGGARGITHIGVIKALEEHGLKFDHISGTSAGSIVGSAWAYGMNWKEMYKLAKEMNLKDIRTNVIPLMPSKTDGIQQILKNNFGDINIEELSTPFTAIAVDLKSTKEIVISHGNLAKAVAGSCAVPGVFVPVEFDDMLLADGGLQNNIPADVLRHFDCDYVIAVDCNKSRLYGTDSSKVVDVISCSIRILMKSNSIKGYIWSDLVVGPETKRFKSTKLEGIDEMIEEGYNETIDMMPQIRALFKKKKPLVPKKKPSKKDVLFVWLVKENITSQHEVGFFIW